MARRRIRKRKTVQNSPFLLYMDMFNAGKEMAELFASSGMVVAYRSDMIARALRGEIPLCHKEFTTMCLEKFLAGGESISAAMHHWEDLQSGTSPLRSLRQIMAPFHTRATRNAKRLHKR